MGGDKKRNESLTEKLERKDWGKSGKWEEEVKGCSEWEERPGLWGPMGRQQRLCRDLRVVGINKQQPGARHQPSSCPRGLNTNLLTSPSPSSPRSSSPSSPSSSPSTSSPSSSSSRPRHHLRLSNCSKDRRLAMWGTKCLTPNHGESFFKATFSSINLLFGPNLKQSCGL